MWNPSALRRLFCTTCTVAPDAATGIIPVTCCMSPFHISKAVFTTGSTFFGS